MGNRAAVPPAAPLQAPYFDALDLAILPDGVIDRILGRFDLRMLRFLYGQNARLRRLIRLHLRPYREDVWESHVCMDFPNLYDTLAPFLSGLPQRNWGARHCCFRSWYEVYVRMNRLPGLFEGADDFPDPQYMERFVLNCAFATAAGAHNEEINKRFLAMVTGFGVGAGGGTLVGAGFGSLIALVVCLGPGGVFAWSTLATGAGVGAAFGGLVGGTAGFVRVALDDQIRVPRQAILPALKWGTGTVAAVGGVGLACYAGIVFMLPSVASGLPTAVVQFLTDLGPFLAQRAPDIFLAVEGGGGLVALFTEAMALSQRSAEVMKILYCCLHRQAMSDRLVPRAGFPPIPIAPAPARTSLICAFSGHLIEPGRLVIYHPPGHGFDVLYYDADRLMDHFVMQLDRGDQWIRDPVTGTQLVDPVGRTPQGNLVLDVNHVNIVGRPTEAALRVVVSSVDAIAAINPALRRQGMNQRMAFHLGIIRQQFAELERRMEEEHRNRD